MERKASLRYFVLSSLALILAAAWIWFSRIPEGGTTSGAIPAPQQGFSAPPFSLDTLDGKEVSIASLRGHPLLVNFWASWCLPCKSEMPAFERAYQDYQAQGFEILAVNALTQDTLTNATQFVRTNNLTFPILLDRTGQTQSTYQITSFPTSFFVDRRGIIQEVVIGGPMTEALLRIRIEKLLQDTP